MAVGNSHRTPTKHCIMCEFVSKEVRVANRFDWMGRLYWFDLSAGNAVPTYDAPWTEACSPGILASRATEASKPVVVDLYEKDADTYATLLDSLAANLPQLGYRRVGEGEWHHAGTKLRALNWNGRHADWSGVQARDVAIVLNDPNSITDWAMHRYFPARLEAMCKGVRTLSCLGFNVGGGKRNDFERDYSKPITESVSARSEWYQLIGSITDFLPQRHDLMLAAFKADAAQWAYLFSASHKWRAEEEEAIDKAFNGGGRPHDYEFAWFKRDRAKFNQLVDRRILTKSEMAERENPPLPFEGGGNENAA
jgi:hypothetical protein